MYLPSLIKFAIAHIMHIVSSTLYAKVYTLYIVIIYIVYHDNVHTLNLKKINNKQ